MKGFFLMVLTLLLVGTCIFGGCAEPSQTPAPSPTPATPPKEKVTIAVPSEIQSLDVTAYKQMQVDQLILANINETLVAFDDDGMPVNGTGIASWDILDDGKIYEFTLRDGVEFSTGDPLTTEDVVFSHNRCMEAPGSAYPRDMRNFDRLEVIDNQKIRFIFKEPEVLFLYTYNLSIASKSYFDRVGAEEFASNPVGTGPYKFVEWKLGEYIDLEYNENYWGPEPAIKQARIIFAPEGTTRVAMLKAGEVDIIMDTPWALVSDVEQSGFKTIRKTNQNSVAITFHCLNPDVPWYDARVRWAIAYAIDRESMVNDLFYGIPELNTWLAPTDPGYDPDLTYSYDVDKAKALLAEAGYAKGFEMPLVYWVTGPGMKDSVDPIVSYLNAVGIKCNVRGIEGPQWFESLRAAKQDTSAVWIHLGGPAIAHKSDPVVGFNMIFYSQGPVTLYNNPQVDALIEEAITTVDPIKRAEIIKQGYKIIHEDMPLVQTMTSVTVYGMKQNVDFTPSRANHPIFLIANININ